MITDYFNLDDERGVMDVLSDEDVTYCGKVIPAVIDYNAQGIAIQDSFISTARITVLALKADVPNIKAGSEFKHGNCRLVVDQIIQDTKLHILASVNHG
jgi:hypothetical protein